MVIDISDKELNKIFQNAVATNGKSLRSDLEYSAALSNVRNKKNVSYNEDGFEVVSCPVCNSCLDDGYDCACGGVDESSENIRREQIADHHDMYHLHFPNEC
jgi:hypothetical protein